MVTSSLSFLYESKIKKELEEVAERNVRHISTQDSSKESSRIQLSSLLSGLILTTTQRSLPNE
jgi:hypothetical protein